MATLEKYTMVYDADCPLCMAYTGAFISTKMLDKDGRIPYQQVGGEFVPGMDAERSKNEIALVNRETGEVRYGLDSLLTVIGARFKWIAAVARLQPLKFFIQKLYNFISYNRKVIVPAQKSATGLYDCTPTFKLKYRIAYILFTWLVTSLVLVEYSKLLGDFIPATNFYREFLICGGQIFFQAIAVSLVTRAKRMDYLGNMMTISLMGALMLLPPLITRNFIGVFHPAVYAAHFALVVSFMLFEHARRMKILELGWWPSVSWVLYRLIVLVLIFASSRLK